MKKFYCRERFLTAPFCMSRKLCGTVMNRSLQNTALCFGEFAVFRWILRANTVRPYVVQCFYVVENFFCRGAHCASVNSALFAVGHDFHARLGIGSPTLHGYFLPFINFIGILMPGTVLNRYVYKVAETCGTVTNRSLQNTAPCFGGFCG